MTTAAAIPNAPSRFRLPRRAVSPLILIALWEIGSRIGLIPARILAAPSQVVATLFDMIASGELQSNLVVSLGRALTGLALGGFIGGGLAIIAGLSKRGELAVDPPVQMLRTLPVLALVQLFIVWFGIGETPKILLIALGVSFPIYLNLYNGIRGVDPKLIEAARTFGLSGPALIRHVILPGAMPSLLLGLRMALTVSWLLLVIAEQINASAGLGYLINNARDFLQTDVIVVCLLVYAAIGLTADAGVRALESRALAWRPSLIKG
ncbi:sulfonate ABC transporter permease [Polymorphobacter glacialis]|uniref:Sulfonate ABC transporter permease n=1 Tax=Sandarakinorhabdus glacialis TaxID=1614636 RepID=A0A916ZUC6_9SPHN|nr:ABC transporter permease subunit [Polymorphobacter glacialis]GGE14279.1 sulfonate ABC transporter permease [Polymorphobacter glacialis]